MAHRRGGSFRGRGISESQRRKRSWFSADGAILVGSDLAATSLTPATLSGPGQTIAVLNFSASDNKLEESTILRIRGYVEVPKSVVNTSSAGNTSVFAFGIGVVSDEAAKSVTGLSGFDAVPNPATASGVDWDGWMFLRSSNQSPVDVTGTILDVKAMRKWKSGDSLVFVAGAATDVAGGVTAQQFTMSLRMLLLLP